MSFSCVAWAASHMIHTSTHGEHTVRRMQPVQNDSLRRTDRHRVMRLRVRSPALWAMWSPASVADAIFD
ncbi:hypothetical protein PsYK624_073590 [Phanerochaete sordida]|uniref:Uncharacterized protein n=1 Tax=Phanerochaete sordida TaxID=48140 RepID=A0A9P3LDF9_9APHY|nr:hypothetical protein PsYK624_073590 [Phanerochaete sordida]